MIPNRKIGLRSAARAGLLLSLAMLCGCVHQGGLASRDLSQYEILISYQREGMSPNATTYHLVRTAQGLALLERSDRGRSVLLRGHWQDEKGDHFFSWSEFVDVKGPGFEVVLPHDRTRKGWGHLYEANGYSVLKVGGSRRIVPELPRVQPSFWLVPVAAENGSAHDNGMPQ